MEESNPNIPLQAKEEKIINQLKRQFVRYDPIIDPNDLEIIYQIFIHQEIPEEIIQNQNPEISGQLANYLGIYYHFFEPDQQLMEKFYQIGISKGNSWSMNNLALYHCKINDRFHDSSRYHHEQTIKYYQMSVDHGNSLAMVNLARYYRNMPHRYGETDQTNCQIRQLYEKALFEGEMDAYYDLLKISEKDLMYGDYLPQLLRNYKKFKQTNQNLTQTNKQLEKQVKEQKAKIEELEDQIEYQPGGPGYIEAKSHFEQQTQSS